MEIYPVILSGGSGTRLWPMSQKSRPKQFLPLLSEDSLFIKTLARLKGLQGAQKPLIVCNHEHRFLVADQLQDAQVDPLSIILEPASRNTAPAVAVAALSVIKHSPDGLILVMPSDHLIEDVSAFHDAIDRGTSIAQSGSLVTFGIMPDSPKTGYGYIQRGVVKNECVYEIKNFIEKPDEQRARYLLEAGDCYWNSGIFLFSAKHFLEELAKFEPDMLKACENALVHSKTEEGFCRLDKSAFEASPSNSIDYAVMEKTSDASVVTVDMGWSDLGSWMSLWEAGNKDSNSNLVRGNPYLEEVDNCVIYLSHTPGKMKRVAAIGVSDLIIVETDDALLVVHKDFEQQVRNAVEGTVKAQQAGIVKELHAAGGNKHHADTG